MKIFVFGSSLTSSYWNGAATYYRGIYSNLHRLGYEITFAQPDVYGRQQKQDVGSVDYATVRVYSPPEETPGLLRDASKADLVIKHSGVGAEDELLEAAVANLSHENVKTIFWDVDAPATLSRVERDPQDPFRDDIPKFDLILTYGGGDPVVSRYEKLGAQACFPIYNGLDPATHHPVPADPQFACDLLFVGNRLPDRERRVEQFFLRAAELAPEMKFILGGEGWSNKPMPANVRWIGHVGTDDHNRLNCSARMVLNLNRDSMADAGFSPPTRIFEAAGAGACLITDSWPGIESFFAPQKELLVASSAEEIVSYLEKVLGAEAQAMGVAMRERALRDHQYSTRAEQVDKIFCEFAVTANAAA